MDNHTVIVNHPIHKYTDNVWMSLLMTRINEAIGDWETRNDRKFNNTEFGDACKASKQTVGDWRKGRTQTMTGEALLNGSDYLGVEPRWLCSGTGSKIIKQSTKLNERSVKFAFEVLSMMDKETQDEIKYEELSGIFSKIYEFGFDDDIRKLDVKTLLKLVQ